MYSGKTISSKTIRRVNDNVAKCMHRFSLCCNCMMYLYLKGSDCNSATLQSLMCACIVAAESPETSAPAGSSAEPITTATSATIQSKTSGKVYTHQHTSTAWHHWHKLLPA